VAPKVLENSWSSAIHLYNSACKGFEFITFYCAEYLGPVQDFVKMTGKTN